MQQEEAQRELDAQTFVRMVGGGAAQLRANVQIVNDLNVFPIPDGDTGENMCLTINGGLHHIEQVETDDLAEAENYKKQTIEQEGKIKSLQDTNMKLFLSKVIEPNMRIDKEDEEPTPATIAQKLF